MIANALNDKPLPVYGTGENVRDWLHVSDHCEAIDLIMIAKYLERIGDHATNIAEWVEFSITGIHAGGTAI